MKRETMFNWQWIDEQVKSGCSLDYFQVFEMTPDTISQSIEGSHLFFIKYHELKMMGTANQVTFLKV